MDTKDERENNEKYPAKKPKGWNLQPYQWKKGQSGNIMGRPKGRSMKDYAQAYLSRMTDEERDEWLEGLPKEVIWKMSEGNWRNDTDVTSGGKPVNITFNSVFNHAESTSETEGNNP